LQGSRAEARALKMSILMLQLGSLFSFLFEVSTFNEKVAAHIGDQTDTSASA
jgi:hypothetical protein